VLAPVNVYLLVPRSLSDVFQIVCSGCVRASFLDLRQGTPKIRRSLARDTPSQICNGKPRAAPSPFALYLRRDFWRVVVKKVVWCLRSLLVAAILTFGVFSANADDRNVQWLYEPCKIQDSDRHGICVGYIAGVGDLMHAFGAYGREG
jgi:hypothetical protein